MFLALPGRWGAAIFPYREGRCQVVSGDGADPASGLRYLPAIASPAATRSRPPLVVKERAVDPRI